MATIYSKFIDIANTVAGEDVSADYPHTIAGAIDALSEALAGAPVDSGQTISEAVAALKPYVSGGEGENVTVYVALNASTVTIEIDGEPVTLADSTDVPNVKEFTAPVGTLASCTTTGSGPSVNIFASLQEIIDDGEFLTQYIVEGDEILMPVLPLALWSF